MSLLSPAGSGGHESSVHALLKQSGEWDFDVIRYCDTVAMLGLWPMASLAMHCMQVRQRDTERAERERESARAHQRERYTDREYQMTDHEDNRSTACVYLYSFDVLGPSGMLVKSFRSKRFLIKELSLLTNTLPHCAYCCPDLARLA